MEHDDIYAIPSQEGEKIICKLNDFPKFCSFLENQYIYFIAIIDPLTNYGFKKQVRLNDCIESLMFMSSQDASMLISNVFDFFQAAKAAKTVKYGSNVDGKILNSKPKTKNLIFAFSFQV